MPRATTTPNVLQRLARAERALAALQREGAVKDELAFFATSYNNLAFEDETTFITLWETVLTPRTATLALGLVLIGDQVSAVNTGGDWRVQFNDAVVVASGTVPATFSFSFPALSLDLTPYRGNAQLKVQIQIRRTAGATTGGRFGGGGCIGGSPTYARLI
jgi:hypothetical protein